MITPASEKSRPTAEQIEGNFAAAMRISLMHNLHGIQMSIDNAVKFGRDSTTHAITSPNGPGMSLYAQRLHQPTAQCIAAVLDAMGFAVEHRPSGIHFDWSPSVCRDVDLNRLCEGRARPDAPPIDAVFEALEVIRKTATTMEDRDKADIRLHLTRNPEMVARLGLPPDSKWLRPEGTSYQGR